MTSQINRWLKWSVYLAVAVFALALATNASGAGSAGFPRPKGATPVSVALVPSYQACISPNRTHVAPVSAASCAPPVQTSPFLTVGTANANGQAANSTGSLKFAVKPGDPTTAADEADIALTASVTDVRRQTDLSDYTGELQANVRLRFTDQASGPAADESATVQDFIYEFTVPCQATVSTTIGATCAVTTSADALQPGTIREGARTLWQLGQVTLLDGGPDGLASTAAGNTEFETQGVFVP
jgi:hypothetical protein